MKAVIKKAGPGDIDEWLRMRRILWEDCPDAEQVKEVGEILKSDEETAFLAERTGGGFCGFLEASLRSRADGCESSPVGFIEGWYVDEDVRREGVGRALVEAAEAWARSNAAATWPPTPSYGTPSATRPTGRSATWKRPDSCCSRRI